MRYTVDASVLVKLVVEEQYSKNAVNLISDPKSILHAPSIIYYEVGSVLYKMIRRGIMEKSYAVRAYENLIKLPIEISNDNWNVLPDILEMSLRHELHFYDCLYMHTASKTGSALVSADRKLLAAAEKECNTKHLGNI
jgi:predicted nucleic acid-binding protein